MTRDELAEDLRVAVPAWITARLLVAAGWVLAEAVARDLLDGKPVALRQGLLAWDGAFYRDIATLGYGGTGGEPLRFFPLYPMTGKVLAPLTLGDEGSALVLVANVAALAAAVLLRRLVLRETGDARLADRATWLLLLVPPAFVLTMAYSEALFLVLAIAFFAAVRRPRWVPAIAWGYLAGLTRPVGVVLAAPAAIEVWRNRRDLHGAGWLPALGSVAAPFAGLATYLAVAAWRHDTFTGPLRAQEEFRGDLVDPVTRTGRAVGDLFGSETFGDGLHLPFALVAIALVVLTARWWPASYSVFAAVLVVLALSADNLNSLERYLLVAFPLVLALARLTAGERAERLALALCGGGTVALTALALLGEYVP
jgi:hypothetical protein